MSTFVDGIGNDAIRRFNEKPWRYEVGVVGGMGHVELIVVLYRRTESFRPSQIYSLFYVIHLPPLGGHSLLKAGVLKEKLFFRQRCRVWEHKIGFGDYSCPPGFKAIQLKCADDQVKAVFVRCSIPAALSAAGLIPDFGRNTRNFVDLV